MDLYHIAIYMSGIYSILISLYIKLLERELDDMKRRIEQLERNLKSYKS